MRNSTGQIHGSGCGKFGLPRWTTALLLAAALPAAARASGVGDVFVIAMENQDFTDPAGSGNQPILGNPAAPFINSLVTPGNPNAADVSYATNYTNAGVGVHPSEPNYIWSEAGTNYNPVSDDTILADTDPSTAAGNVFSATPHLTGLMNAAGISWKNYQEDYQVSGQGPLVSASGVLPGGAANPYNGSDLYNYAAKHNPMAFFPDSATQNVFALGQLSTDLTDNTVGRYNWITPDQYNDMHTKLSAGFKYHGTTYLNDEAEVAQGDNFLSILVPQIESSAAFKNNGVIIIWTDETEGGDSTANDLTEIVISPLAKGNAYAGSVPLSHSSDLKTMQEIFGLGPTYLNNAIPAGEYSVTGGPGTVGSVSTVNDLGDLFQPGVIDPLPAVWSGGVGNWSDATRWTAGVVPTGSTTEVQIETGASAVMLDQDASVGDLVLGTGQSLTINSGRTLTLNGPTTTSVGGALTNNGALVAAALNIGSAGSVDSPAGASISGSGTWTNRGVTVIAGNQSWTAGSVFVNAAGTTTFGSDAGVGGPDLTVVVNAGTVAFGATQHLAALNIGSGGLARVTAGGSAQPPLIVTKTLSVDGTLDVGTGALDIQAGDLQTITSLVVRGFGAPADHWAGPGITSTAAAADTTHLTALGVVQNNQSGGLLYTGANPFDGTVPGPGDILVRYTYFGDANLDGKVDGSDYSLIDAGYESDGALTGWFNGDFNYDGTVDGSDYALIDNAFNNQSAPGVGGTAALVAADPTQIAPPASAVPEPVSIAVIAFARLVPSRRRVAHRRSNTHRLASRSLARQA
jgi:hypothetical protein